MTRRVTGSFSAALAAMVLLSPAFLAAQASSDAKAKAADTKTGETKSAETKDAKPYVVPHTPDGQPDIQGYWTSLSFTPMERPAKYGNREFLTDKEMQEVFKAGIQHTYEFTFGNDAETPVYDATVYALGAWQNGVQPNKRTSLIVDPPDGRIPPLTPEVAKARAGMKRGLYGDLENENVERAENPEDLGNGVRCLSMGGPPILPGQYDSNTHIVQGPGYVLVEYEWNSEARIIPLDGAPHLPASMPQWHGDSRGHWEGNTLVVDTVDFRPDNTYQRADAKALHITEYFTRLNAKTLEYKFTINDPLTWTKPWTAIEPLSQVEGPMFEYACSEGNNGMINTLAGARAAEKEKAATGETPKKAMPKKD